LSAGLAVPVPPGRHRSYGAARAERKGESLPIMATLARTWQRFAHNDQLLLFLLAVAVGIAGGYGAVAFRLATSGFRRRQ
jgi:hypothetical protein